MWVESYPPADMHFVSSIEVWNGGGSHVRFWEQQLQKGFRVTAVGGSDNHHGDWPLDKQGSVGSPTTVVHAEHLSAQVSLASPPAMSFSISPARATACSI